MIRNNNTIEGVLDRYTGENVTYNKVTTHADGSNMDDSKCDGVLYRKSGNEYFKKGYSGYINPEWFGIKGDGITDNTLSYRTMLDTLQGTGSILFKRGTYLGVMEKPNCGGLQIIGESRQTTIFKVPNGINKTLFKFANSNNMKFADITLDGNRANNTVDEAYDFGETNANDCIYFSKGNNYSFLNINVKNGHGGGINGYSVSGLNVNNCDIRDCSTDPLNQNLVTIQYSPGATGSFICFNTFANIQTGAAYSSFGSNGVKFIGNNIENCYNAFSSEWGGSDNQYSLNRVKNCKQVSIFTDKEGTSLSRNNVISYNIATEMTNSDDSTLTDDAFISLLGVSGIKVYGNQIYALSGNSMNGIKMQLCTDVDIVENTVVGAGRNGLYIATNGEYYPSAYTTTVNKEIKIRGNKFKSSSLRGVFVEGGENIRIDLNDGISNNLGAGIELLNVNGAQVRLNDIRLNGDHGIVFNNSSNVVEELNTFSSNSSGNYLLVGSNTNLVYSLNKKTLVNSLEVISNHPNQSFLNTDADADNRLIDIDNGSYGGGAAWALRLLNDDNTVATTVMLVQRVGMDISNISFPNHPVAGQDAVEDNQFLTKRQVRGVAVPNGSSIDTLLASLRGAGLIAT